ncbi:two-component sensor histidine kinase [Treponema phagedenis]|uniref:histidine kinase n=1 Tax=Treponema phagedenis TaxID=162 RepID=A0A0B7GUW9_TREPH|nr:histidine kinase [Treponema phagedenis]NVP24225.1 two-component sensor histidine kinase [Treponema phagedenis]QEJ94199.1 two-component sensor histidine kinase [Treponema phagedenis]QEJ99216.1 two-component sensor histidine kinase [Treponema phagedenis]QEK00157.1 two-component sensor histidine kinase [Treponema phagedenis]QEK04782.1 two-component sensor histidine kinase [Treponema phagedenis]
MLLFLENFLITFFCSLLLKENFPDAMGIEYFIIIFSACLWLYITDNKKWKILFLAGFIFSVFVVDATLCFFSPAFITIDLKLSNKKIKPASFEIPTDLVFKLIPISCIFFNFNILLFIFSLVVFFYSGIKENYFLTAAELTMLQDILSENKLHAEKQKRIFQIDLLKNAEVSILAERNRISGVLHNSIGHTLSSAILQVNALKYIADNEEVKDKLAVLQTSLETGMTEIRKSLHNIHDTSFNLQTALDKLIEKISNPKIKLIYKIDALPYVLKHDIISIIKEGIANTVKHSGATLMDIILLEHRGFYSVVINDNGCGFNSSVPIQEGIGLSVLREIVEKNNGTINFYSDGGFKIHIIFPKQIAEAENEHHNN